LTIPATRAGRASRWLCTPPWLTSRPRPRRRQSPSWRRGPLPARGRGSCPALLALLVLVVSLSSCTSDTVVTRALESCDGAPCPCEAGQELCEGACRDTRVDPLHCGACNQRCQPGQRCAAGQCVCREGLLRCAGACVDPRSDARNCGGCDAPCHDTNPYCADGTCTAQACRDRSPPTSGCGVSATSCVPESLHDEHPLHCGGCDGRCAANQVCVEGLCQPYVPQAGCAACPCSACGEDLCCDSSEIGLVICLPEALHCPG
jgi:hypothetical protein